MKLTYSKPVIYGVVSAKSLGAANRYQGSTACCSCTAHGNSRA